MHASSFENMLKCYNRYVAGTEFEERPLVDVLDIGGAYVNGTYRSIFPDTRFRYRTADLELNTGVDVVLTDPYSLPLDDRSIDIVISGQAFEHIEFFWQTFSEMVRVLKPDGFIFLIAPSTGPEHRYPVDCYRFYPDAFAGLAKHARCQLIDIWRDERGPWCDLVGVFRHIGSRQLARKVGAKEPLPRDLSNEVVGTWDEETVRGTASYLDVLARLHETLQPANYLEIGVRHGYSLALAAGAAVGVDPQPDLVVQLPTGIRVAACTSDEFFDAGQLEAATDFAFIDGMHLFEFALRDFMNIERAAVPGSALVIDDVLPAHPAQAERVRRTRVWTGDVWKLVEIIRTYRPDLFLTTIDTMPTGLALVAGLDPDNRVLWEQYNSIVRRFGEIDIPPRQVLERDDALDPLGEHFAALLRCLSASYQRSAPPSEVVTKLRETACSRQSRSVKLSVVVVAFNMPRELPRTIRTLSPDFQRDIDASDYEIVVVDNGSTPPVDERELRQLAQNLRVCRMKDATVSPVPAIQFGLEAARGELVGVLIDGARMVSPGLLSKAMSASKLHELPAIGTIAFHLGPKVQMQSILEGYDQAAEDALLASSHWETDGYKLFGISALADSSDGGWLDLPRESNAIFLRASHWRELGGYEPRFVSPGGGLANLDVWKRICDDPRSMLIMLLGEATFHQIHGGIATNSRISRWKQFHDEYVRIRGQPYASPKRRPHFFGTLPPSAGPHR